jgi:membrane-associated phospholipid phosphatase
MTATAMTYWLRHPDSPARWAMAGGALGLTTLTAVGRVQAGKHFPSDVVAGAILGSSIGLLVPWIHRSEAQLEAAVAPVPYGARVTLQGTLPSLAAQGRSR